MTQSSLSRIAKQERTRREILHKSDLIPPLPDLVARVLGVLNDKDTEPEDLEKLLQNDQVLVAKMLAMVNSPFYGLNRTIRTIKDAVMVLGFRGVRSLVLATSTAKFLQRDYGWYGHEPKGLWLHAVCVAAGARLLASKSGMSADDCEQLFIGGLLHDIGKLLLVPYLDGAAPAAPGESLLDVERRHVGLDHAEAGGLVADKWHLPAEIGEIIASQHAGAERAESVSKGAALVGVADSVAHELGVGYLPDRAPKEVVSEQQLRALGLLASWPTVRDELAAAMDEAVLALGDLSS